VFITNQSKQSKLGKPNEIFLPFPPCVAVCMLISFDPHGYCSPAPPLQLSPPWSQPLALMIAHSQPQQQHNTSCAASRACSDRQVLLLAVVEKPQLGCCSDHCLYLHPVATISYQPALPTIISSSLPDPNQLKQPL